MHCNKYSSPKVIHIILIKQFKIKDPTLALSFVGNDIICCNKMCFRNTDTNGGKKIQIHKKRRQHSKECMCRLQNIALESVTDGKCDRPTDGQTDRRTDDRQSDPYVSLCFAGDTNKRPMWATVAHLSTMNASKIWHQNGTKNNKASSHMLQDHCYAFGLLL